MNHAAGRLALVLWLCGAGTVLATWYDSGNQPSAAGELPAVLVAWGAGLGLLVAGAALWSIDRARARQARFERLAGEVAR